MFRTSYSLNEHAVHETHNSKALTSHMHIGSLSKYEGYEGYPFLFFIYNIYNIYEIMFSLDL